MMHELSIALALIDVAAAESRRAGATRVSRVRCRVGELRQIEDALLREAFDVAREGTCCGAAELIIEKAPLRAWCPRCRAAFAVQQWRWNCPECGVEGEPRAGGDELELLSIDVEAPT